MKISNESRYDKGTFFPKNKIRPISKISNKAVLLFVGIDDGDPLVCYLDDTNKNSLFAVPLESYIAHSQSPVVLETEDEELLKLIEDLPDLDMEKLLKKR